MMENFKTSSLLEGGGVIISDLFASEIEDGFGCWVSVESTLKCFISVDIAVKNRKTSV